MLQILCLVELHVLEECMVQLLLKMMKSYPASRDKMIGATLYLVGRDVKTGEKLSVSEPCSMCKRMIINAGITDVVSQDINGEIIHTSVEDWIIHDESL